MTVILLILAMVFGSEPSTGQSYHGVATYYAHSVMEQVYANRLHWGQVQPCPECVGMVALLDCERIGSKVWLRHNEEVVGPYLVVDCAAKRDLSTIRKRQIVAEVSYEQGLAWHMAGPIPVEVLQ